MASEFDGKNWITSRRILSLTGISRATLNNYIKMGILPRPVVRQEYRDGPGSKQIGYFPADAPERIQKVKELKKEGVSMSDIVKILGKVEDRRSRTRIYSISSRLDQTSTSGEPIAHRPLSETDKDGEEAIRVTIDDLNTPSYLIGSDEEIAWINREAESTFFNFPVSSSDKPEDRNIFRLFSDDRFQDQFLNWEELMAFHIPFLKARFEKLNMDHLFKGLSERQTTFLENKHNRNIRLSDTGVYDTTISLVRKEGTIQEYRVYVIFFREGIFFAFVDKDRLSKEIEYLISHRETMALNLMDACIPTLQSFVVLVITLQDAKKLSLNLLPADFFKLVNELWETTERCAKHYGVIPGRQTGTRGIFYMMENQTVDYVMETIQYAFALKKQVTALSVDWKNRKGWPLDIHCNIAIDTGQEHCGTIQTAGGVVFTSLGDSLETAVDLSEFGEPGSVWATKRVLESLPPEQLKRIDFGVQQRINQQFVFMRNSFASVSELAHSLGQDTPTRRSISDHRTTPITGIQGVIEDE